MSHSQYTTKLAHGKVSGATWYKSIWGGAHLLHNPPAICFDVDDLTQAEQAGAVSVDVVDTETGTHYQTEIATIRTKGFPVRRGYGEQIGLPLYSFLRTGPALAELAKPAEPPKPRQLDIFGEVTHGR